MPQEAKHPLEVLGYLFYAVSPEKTSFEKMEEVPDYITEVVPFFIMFLLIELFVGLWKKKPVHRVNDCIGSISQGMLQELSKVLVRGIQFAAYIYIYNNWRIVTLPWDSAWTWWICFLGVDLGYYWLHRASHEINILWAAHQVHHSSEDYNLSTALRQSVFQNYSVWMFYLPLAFGIPPSVFLVHHQFNTLYQFWIHTEFIRNLGPLEYVLNTASHHRVHHGRNRYCIDKNYAGTLIIWDRMFGTFEAESEQVVYGLTHPINTFQPFQVQLAHYIHIWKTFWEMKGLKNKLSVIFKGPGWEPGKPWHGCIEDIPDVHAPVEKYDPKLPTWLNIYVAVHFILVVLGQIEITERYGSFSQTIVLSAILYQIFSLTSIGALLDGKSYASWLEFLRCVMFFGVDYYLLPVTRVAMASAGVRWCFLSFLRVYFLFSAILWSWLCLKSTSVHFHSKKVQ